MILRYKNEAGEEWLISSPAATEELARHAVESPVSVDSPSIVSSNGSGPWTYDGIAHEHSFPHDLVEAEQDARTPERVRAEIAGLLDEYARLTGVDINAQQ